MTWLFAYPFRIFFLSVAVLSVTAIPAWLWMLFVSGQLPLGLAPLQWHQHEMLFGLLDAAIAGFLLTAACNWGDAPVAAEGLCAHGPEQDWRRRARAARRAGLFG